VHPAALRAGGSEDLRQRFPEVRISHQAEHSFHGKVNTFGVVREIDLKTAVVVLEW